MTRFSSLALAALLSGTAPVAYAQTAIACDPAVPSDGDTITCAGTGIGVEDSSLDNLTITVTDTGVIAGGSRGLRFDDDSSVVNHGSITGTSDHGIQGDNNVAVVNHGTIIGLGGDGVNIDDDGRLVNYGTIISRDDDGVQLEANPQVANHGIIDAVDEGINVNVDNARVLNTGTVTAVDDGINAANAAMIWNSGTITSTGAQDAVDLDSGSIFNAGTLQSTGGEDGIDFDAGGTQASYVMNTGVISGNIGINTDGADTQSQHITNAGQIIGTSGTAINLGGGDDSLTVLDGSQITGLVQLGAGTDTLVVNSRQAQVLSFADLPEVTQLSGNALFAAIPGTAPAAPAQALATASAVIPAGAVGVLVVADNTPLSQPDVLAREIGFGLGQSVLDAQGARGLWMTGGFSRSDISPSNAQSAALAQRHAVFGYGIGDSGLTAILGYGQGSSELADNQHEVRIRAYMLGLGYERQMGRFTLGSAAYLGRSHNAISSPDTASGEADFDGKFYGLSLRGSGMLMDRGDAMGLDIVVQGDVLRHQMDGYTLSGLAGASIDSRASTATALRLELGAPMTNNDATLRPYVALSHFGGQQDDLSLSLFGNSTSFAAAEVLSRNEVALGATFTSSTGGLKGRIELTQDNDGNRGFGAGFGIAF